MKKQISLPKRARKSTPVPRIPAQQQVAAAYSRGLRPGAAPKWVMLNSKGDVRISHSEFVKDLAGSVAFSAALSSINPGLATLFPWLSGVAISWESYAFRQLAFRYETEKSSATSGAVLMAVDFDAADSVPTSKQELMSNKCKARSALWAPLKMTVEASDEATLGVRRYTRPGSLASNLDIKTYDVGNLVLASQGAADTTDVGEIYVDYVIDLFTPQPNSKALLYANTAKVASASSSDTNFYGTATITGGLPITASGDTMTFNKVGAYSVLQVPTGTGLTDALAVAVSGTASIGQTLTGGPYANAAGTLAAINFAVTVTAVGQTLITDWSAATTVSSANTYVSGYLVSL
jgi:hypothetical protein